MNGYQLTDAWFEFRFQHPEKVTHAHTELYFYLVYHWNKLSQKDKFGLPSAITMEATGIRNYKTYSKCLNDLAEFGFIRIVQKAINQHQAVVVAWGKNTKADTEALPEALTKAQHEALPYIDELKNYRTIEQKNEKIDLSDLSSFDSILQSLYEFQHWHGLFLTNLDPGLFFCWLWDEDGRPHIWVLKGIYGDKQFHG